MDRRAICTSKSNTTVAEMDFPAPSGRRKTISSYEMMIKSALYFMKSGGSHKEIVSCLKCKYDLPTQDVKENVKDAIDCMLYAGLLYKHTQKPLRYKLTPKGRLMKMKPKCKKKNSKTCNTKTRKRKQAGNCKCVDRSVSACHLQGSRTMLKSSSNYRSKRDSGSSSEKSSKKSSSCSITSSNRSVTQRPRAKHKVLRRSNCSLSRKSVSNHRAVSATKQCTRQPRNINQRRSRSLSKRSSGVLHSNNRKRLAHSVPSFSRTPRSKTSNAHQRCNKSRSGSKCSLIPKPSSDRISTQRVHQNKGSKTSYPKHCYKRCPFRKSQERVCSPFKKKVCRKNIGCHPSLKLCANSSHPCQATRCRYASPCRKSQRPSCSNLSGTKLACKKSSCQKRELKPCLKQSQNSTCRKNVSKTSSCKLKSCCRKNTCSSKLKPTRRQAECSTQYEAHSKSPNHWSSSFSSNDPSNLDCTLAEPVVCTTLSDVGRYMAKTNSAVSDKYPFPKAKALRTNLCNKCGKRKYRT